MASRNGHSVYDLIHRGFKRKTRKLNDKGEIGIAIPGKFVDENNIGKSEDVAILEIEDVDHAAFEVHFEPDEP